MSIQSDTLANQVAAETGAEEAALLLLNGLLEQFEAAGSDLNKIATWKQDLAANKEKFAEAVVANTARFGTTSAPAPPAARDAKEK